MFTSHNSVETFISALGAALAANRQHIFMFRVRCVAIKHMDKWVNRLCVVRGYDESLSPPTQGNEVKDYGKVALLESLIKPSDLVQFISAIAGGKSKIGGLQVQMGPMHWTEDRHPSHNSYCEAPARVFRGRLVTPQQSDDAPLVHYELDCYASLSDAVRAWSDFRETSVASGSDSGSVIIVVPEYRAALLNFLYRNNQPFVMIARGETRQNVVLQMTWSRRGAFGHSRICIDGPELQLPIPPGCEQVHLWLMDESGEVLDFHQEFAHHPNSMRKVLKSSDSNERRSSILQAIKYGESERIEFKPFIEPAHMKVEEVVRTVIAFANTKGGRIIVGVDKACQVIGIEQQLMSAYRQYRGGFTSPSPDNENGERGQVMASALDWYIGRLRSLLRDNIHPDLDVEITSEGVSGETIVVITVEEGLKAVYEWPGRKPGVWVRRSANNVYPDSDEWPRLLQRSGMTSLSFGNGA